MKLKHLFFLVLLTFSCNSPDSDLLQIDPRDWVENKITLAEIADDITYIPMDNSYPFRASPNLRPQIINNTILLFLGDIGILKFNRDGKMIRKIGSMGRGPGEYMFSSFTVDDKTGTIYIMDRDNKIKIYSINGIFIREIPLKEYEGFYPKVDVYNSKLFVSYFLIGGKAKYNWIILDTLGNLIKTKENSIPPFSDNIGIGGGTYKYDNKLFYWNLYNDTVFSILPDLSYKAAVLFSPGKHRWPQSNLDASQINESQISSYLWPLFLFETNRFLVFYFDYNKKMKVSFIDKKSKKIFLTYRESNNYNILNDIDGGIMFDPVMHSYFVENNQEYLFGLLDTYKLKTYVESDEFKNFIPKYPEKKKELIKLVISLKETDNPILMLVKLKK